MGLYLNINDETAFFPSNKKLTPSFIELNYLNKTLNGHWLLVDQVEMLIEDDEFEVFRTSKVESVLPGIAQT